MSRAVVVMAKAPVAGRSKTRLGRDIGMARAAQVSRFLIDRTMDAALQGQARGWWSVRLAADPAASICEPRFRRNGRVDVFHQARGDLGERILAAMKIASSGGPTIIIGADAPAVSAVLIERAFRVLNAGDFVFGPAADGGFWLFGVKRVDLLPRSFEGVRWSTKNAMGDVVERLPERRIVFADTLDDIDTLTDLNGAGPSALFASGRRRPMFD
ncbi:MAG: TIGR04282 family arsenosugar biosynthesis glycosyltransferase [Pseudomonadota bacterium]